MFRVISVLNTELSLTSISNIYIIEDLYEPLDSLNVNFYLSPNINMRTVSYLDSFDKFKTSSLLVAKLYSNIKNSLIVTSNNKTFYIKNKIILLDEIEYPRSSLECITTYWINAPFNSSLKESIIIKNVLNVNLNEAKNIKNAFRYTDPIHRKKSLEILNTTAHIIKSKFSVPLQDSLKVKSKFSVPLQDALKVKSKFSVPLQDALKVKSKFSVPLQEISRIKQSVKFYNVASTRIVSIFIVDTESKNIINSSLEQYIEYQDRSKIKKELILSDAFIDTTSFVLELKVNK